MTNGHFAFMERNKTIQPFVLTIDHTAVISAKAIGKQLQVENLDTMQLTQTTTMKSMAVLMAGF
jgi:hypothetical protein